ncbi:MAG: Holliday junction branch migration protein RuvA [Candidatus Aureabacteria bacterium]|nr:Holliday junction branch migration protein RuvA [Candidatus Auribacterota bacterium]
MISFLRGQLVKKQPTKVEIDVSGVGYEVHIPLSTYDSLPQAGQDVFLLTHHYVREDAQVLYGFIDEEERELFRLLIQVNRVGPKLALSVLSRMSAKDFKSCVVSENVSSIAGISGVGKKTAERIVIELKEKIPKMTFSLKAGEKAESTGEKILMEAVSALESLGFKRDIAYRMCIKIMDEKSCAVEDLIRIALRRMS